MMLWLNLLKLHLATGDFKQINQEHDMRADGLLFGTEMDMIFLHWMAWNWPIYELLNFCSALVTALSFILRLLQPASFALVCFCL